MDVALHIPLIDIFLVAWLGVFIAEHARTLFRTLEAQVRKMRQRRSTSAR